MPEKQYDHNQIELKWFERWRDAEFYQAEENSSRPKFYVLEMLPYPSGEPHVGHLKVYAVGDAIAHFRRRQGFQVLRNYAWPRSLRQSGGS